MRTRTLLQSLGLTALACFFTFAPDLSSRYVAWSRASDYEVAHFVVTGSRCTGGERVRDSQGSWRSERTRCRYEGTIDGREESFATGSSLPGNHPPGSSLKVWFDRETYATGLAGESLRILWFVEDLESNMKRRALGTSAALLLALLGVVVVNALYWVRAPGRNTRGAEPRSALDMGGGMPYLGIPLLSLGAAAALEPLLSGTPPDGRWLFGLILLMLGPPLIARRAVRFETGRILAQSWSWFGVPVRRGSVSVPDQGGVLVTSGKGGTYDVRLMGQEGAGGQILGAFDDPALARTAGERIAGFLECPLTVDEPAPRRIRSVSLKTKLVGVVLLVVAGAALVPGVREQAYLAGLRPDISLVPELRRFAARRLADYPTNESVDTLVRLVNTTYDDHPALAADSIASLEQIAGHEFGGVDDWWEVTARLNPWAAERLGRSLDAHGGVLGWYPVDGRLRSRLDEIASEDPATAWMAWAGFAAGDVASPEAFLLMAGAGLGDPRPIAFAIVRIPEGESGGPYTGLSDPIAAYSDGVLARTVGEALALRYWDYLAGRSERLVARTDSQALALQSRLEIAEFPDDFRSWWSEYARRHRLPAVADQRPQ